MKLTVELPQSSRYLEEMRLTSRWIQIIPIIPAFCAFLAMSLTSAATSASQEEIRRAWSQISKAPKIAVLLKNPANQFRFKDVVDSNGIRSVRFQHYFHRLEVIGSLVMEQTFAKDGTSRTETVDEVARVTLNTRASIDAHSATKRVREALHLEVGKPALKILPATGAVRLIYVFETQGSLLSGSREIFLDAHTGEILGNISKETPFRSS